MICGSISLVDDCTWRHFHDEKLEGTFDPASTFHFLSKPLSYSVWNSDGRDGGDQSLLCGSFGG